MSSSPSDSIPEDAQKEIDSFLQGGFDQQETSLVDVKLPEAIKDAWSHADRPRRLIEAVKLLGPSLTSDDEQRRLRAVVLLSSLVIALADDERLRIRLFDKQSITTLAAFFAQKIEDGNTVAANIAQSLNASTAMVPETAPEFRKRKYPAGTEMLIAALRALQTLSKMDGFASEAAKVTAENLLKHSSPRVHPQSIRFLIFTLMDALISRNRNALKQMGKEFVNGYIELIEGEKDPRNLVYIFAMDRVVLIEFHDLMEAEAVENFFDCTYCYFPITFRPPPDDPYGISTNSLRIALRRVLCASPLLAPHALPLLIEKMQASGGNAKRDTLDTLADALPIFGRSAALAHARELWQGYRIEIMHATDEATSICAQRALESLLFVLYAGQETPTAASQGNAEDESAMDEKPVSSALATEIVADMLDELEEPSKQQAKPACTILGVMIRATPFTSRLAIKGALDQLFGMYRQTDDISVRPAILDHLTVLVKAMREVYSANDDIDGGLRPPLLRDQQVKEEGKFTFVKPTSDADDVDQRKALVLDVARTYDTDGRPMDGERDVLISTLAHGLGTMTTRGSGVELFVNLSHIDILSFLELRHLCESVNAMLVDPNAEQVRVQALDGLRDLGSQDIVEETTLPLLFNTLPDRIIEENEEKVELVKGNIRRSLGALARLCDSVEFFELLVVRLSTKLDILCSATNSLRSGKLLEANVGYARGLLSTLSFVLQRKMHQKHLDTAKYGLNIVPRMLAIVLNAAALAEQGQSAIATDKRLIRSIGHLVMLLTQCLDTIKQQQLGQVLYKALYEGDTTPLAKATGTSALARLKDDRVNLLTRDASSQQRDVVFTFAMAIVALRRDAHSFEQDDVVGKLGNLLDWTMKAQNKLQEEAGSHLAADWINKHVVEPMPEALERRLSQFWVTEVEQSEAKDGMDVDRGTRETRTRMQRTRRAIRIWLAITRGFLVRNSRQAEGMVSRVLTLFEDRKAGNIVYEGARGMGTLLRDDDILCKENGSVIRLLFRQRFVTFVLPKLLAGHKSSSKQDSVIYLVAICSLLPSLPRATLLDKLTDLFPLLILALDVGGDQRDKQDDGVVQASAAQVITLAAAVGKRQRDEAIMNGRAATALGKTPSQAVTQAATERNSLDLVNDHLHAIIKRAIAIIGDESASVSTKVAVLRCLKTIAQTIEYTTLHPQKHAVLRALGHFRKQGIDDSKRDVRLEAVDCRDAWFRLKGEEEEDEGTGGAGV